MKFTAWVIASAILTSVPAWSADIFTNELPRPFNLADPLESDASIGGYPIWNGDGKWRFVDATRRDTVSNRGETTPIGDVILFQTGEKRLVATMTVSANLRGSSTRWLGEPCKRDDLLFKANIGRSTWEDNCFTLNHITHYLGNPGGKSAELYALLKTQGVNIPSTVLELTFTRNGTSGNFLNITIKINPEAFGFASEPEVEWGRNPWNKTMSFSDPIKKQFIDALGEWGLAFARKMDSALAQKRDAFSSTPSLQTLRIGTSKPPTQKSSIPAD